MVFFMQKREGRQRFFRLMAKFTSSVLSWIHWVVNEPISYPGTRRCR